MENPGGVAAGSAVEINLEKRAVLRLDVEVGAVAAASPVLLRGGARKAPIMPGMFDGGDAILLLPPDEGCWLCRNAVALNGYLLADEL